MNDYKELFNLFLFVCSLCCFLLSWNISLLESRYFWRRKWEEELNKRGVDFDYFIKK